MFYIFSIILNIPVDYMFILVISQLKDLFQACLRMFLIDLLIISRVIPNDSVLIPLKTFLLYKIPALPGILRMITAKKKG